MIAGRYPLKPCSILVLLAVQLLFVGCASQKAAPPQVAQATNAPSTYVSPEMLSTIEGYYGPVVATRVARWQEIIATSRQFSEEGNLERVNDFFNGAVFADDREVWGREDYWATPLEFIIMDAGDCEDFAMAKYFTLEQMGIDSDRMRLTYCRALTIDRAHMVVAYYPSASGMPVILDNLNLRIRPADERTDLQPVYSFNGQSLWLARSGREDVKTGGADSLALWQDWLARTEKREVPLNLVVGRGP